jgi:hypothetical protein
MIVRLRVSQTHVVQGVDIGAFAFELWRQNRICAGMTEGLW